MPLRECTSEFMPKNSNVTSHDREREREGKKSLDDFLVKYFNANCWANKAAVAVAAAHTDTDTLANFEPWANFLEITFRWASANTLQTPLRTFIFSARIYLF